MLVQYSVLAATHGQLCSILWQPFVKLTTRSYLAVDKAAPLYTGSPSLKIKPMPIIGCRIALEQTGLEAMLRNGSREYKVDCNWGGVGKCTHTPLTFLLLKQKMILTTLHSRQHVLSICIHCSCSIKLLKII